MAKKEETVEAGAVECECIRTCFHDSRRYVKGNVYVVVEPNKHFRPLKGSSKADSALS